uniref:Uncharacterized protein n=1 Tax=Ascaris lumbricoides TaxID=6252 RepID=A0A0M3IQK9_ASCLU
MSKLSIESFRNMSHRAYTLISFFRYSYQNSIETM